MTTTPEKEKRYQELMPGLRELAGAEPGFNAAVGNLLAALKEGMPWLWVGLYRVVPARRPGAHAEELLLDLFQGPVACTRIAFGKGVCGTCWQRGESIVVPDVNAFPGHIACSALSRSEIVVPVFRDGRVAGVLDVDSETPGAFDETDRRYLEMVAALIAEKL